MNSHKTLLMTTLNRWVLKGCIKKHSHDEKQIFPTARIKRMIQNPV